MPQLIYLACPYQHSDPAVMQQRFEQINKIAATLIANGDFVFSPISHTHPIGQSGDLPSGWRYWEAYDTRMLCVCDKLVVAMLDGWSMSTGVINEIAIAKRLDLPIEYLAVTTIL